MSAHALKSLLALSYILVGTGNVIAQAQTTAPASASASACASSIAPRNGAPSVAPGWRVEVVASGLTDPRGILFDSNGALLVVQQASGISRLSLTGDDGACVRAEGEPQTVVDDNSLNHGIALSADGKTLYASSATGVFAWDYDGSQGRTTSESREIIGGMGDADGHVTRTLLLSQKEDGMLLVSRGSMSNLDPAALDVTTGVSTIKAFQINNVTDDAYNFAEDGILLGWGLRNSVGVAEDPITGAIYSVENSVDNFERNGENIHQNNPGEEMNFHGYLNGTQVREQGTNYGYPTCYAAWDVNEIPDRDGIDVGTQFAIGTQNDTVNDDICRNNRTGPRLTFPAHTAPLDMKFNSNGTAAWVTFHGSWNRDDPIGYKLSVIPFDGNGSPTAPANSNNSTVDVVSNPDLSRCPSNCIRPVGLAWDSKGRLFMSSDATGEIFVVVREDGGSVDQANPTSGLPTPTGSGAGPSESTGAAIKRWDVGEGSYWVAAAAMAGAIPLMEGMAI